MNVIACGVLTDLFRCPRVLDVDEEEGDDDADEGDLSEDPAVGRCPAVRRRFNPVAADAGDEEWSPPVRLTLCS